MGLTAAAGTHLDSSCNADQSYIPQEGPSSPKANPTPTPVMVSKSTQHNIPHVADEENATPILSSQNPECKTCKDRGKQIQKLKEEVKRKSASIETVLNENDKLAQELAQAKIEAQLAEVQNQRPRNILEQKQMDLAQANFTKTQYELDFKHTVAHYEELYSLCLKHGIDIPLPEPETLFLNRKNKSKPSNPKERHQQESTTHYSIPTQNRFTTLSDSSTHPTDVNNVTSHIWWNTTAKRSPTKERRPTQTKFYYQDNSAKDSPKQSRQSPKDHSTTHPWRVHSPKGNTEKRHSPTAHKTNPSYKRTTPNHSFRRDATHSQGRQGQKL